MKPHQALMAAFGLAVSVLQLPAFAQAFVEPCVRSETFPRPTVNGPFDYRNERGALQMVESNHFIPQIENLVRGKSSTLAAELSFVLHGFPNHHRALATLIRYSERERSPQPADLDYSVDCYFLRAIRFRADDMIVRMLFADHLSRTRRPTEAAAQLEYVKAASPDNPLTQHNIGLLYFQLGRYKDATAQAHLAMAMGLPRTDLRDLLKAKGQWTDAPPAPADSPASAASAPGA